MLKAKRSELFDKPYQIENLEDITDTFVFHFYSIHLDYLLIIKIID